MEAFRFSTGLDPEHHRQAVSIPKLMSVYGLSRDQLVEAAENETDGYVFRDYYFRLRLEEEEHSLDNEHLDTAPKASAGVERER